MVVLAYKIIQLQESTEEEDVIDLEHVYQLWNWLSNVAILVYKPVFYVGKVEHWIDVMSHLMVKEFPML